MNGLLKGNRISDLTAYIKKSLVSSGIEEREAVQIMKWLMEDLLQKPYVEWILNGDATLSESELLKLHFKLKRIIAHEPVQYVLGYTWFMGKRINVNAAVLIPRPETEELVKMVLERIKGKESGHLIDFGTGSGCIAVVLKDKLTHWDISAVDISNGALEMAKSNAVVHQVEVNFIQDNILDLRHAYDKVDVIVSNPPYVLESDQAMMHPNVVHHEPHLALFVPDNDACLFYSKIIDWAKEYLNFGGLVAFEVHENYANDISELLLKSGFKQEIVKDLQDKERFVFGTR